MTSETDRELGNSFTDFARVHEPRLLRALTSRYGVERGSEATAEALAWGWEHWGRVKSMENPAGYLFRVGASRTKDLLRRPISLPPVQTERWPWVEPSLPHALSRLSGNQRTAVLLVHGYGWTYAEVAEVMGIGLSTVQKHVDRALTKLRDSLEVNVGA